MDLEIGAQLHTTSTALKMLVDNDRRIHEGDRKAGIFKFPFDASKPHRPQLDRAQRLLRQFVKPTTPRKIGGEGGRRAHRKHWPLYLRILDAHESCGDDWANIGKVLWPDPPKGEENVSHLAKRTYKQALKVLLDFPRHKLW